MASSIFFPSPQRNFKGQRWARISLRTLHLISIAFLVGGVAQGVSIAEMPHSFWSTIVTGLLFTALELFSTFRWLFQLKGWAVLLKMVLLAAAYLSPEAALEFLLAAIVIGGISSHMPGKYRYYSLLHGKEIKE